MNPLPLLHLPLPKGKGGDIPCISSPAVILLQKTTVILIIESKS